MFLQKSIDTRAYSNKNLGDFKDFSLADLIFRQGIGYDSLVIQELSQSKYSHLGLIISTDPVLILHATTDDDPLKSDQVLVSSLEDFLSLSKSIALKRYDLSDEQKKLIVKKALQKEGEKFVLRADGFYCTSLIEQAFEDIYTLKLNKTKLDIPFLSGEYLLPKSLFEDEKSLLILERTFN